MYVGKQLWQGENLEPEDNHLLWPTLHLQYCVQLYSKPHHQGIGTGVRHAYRIFLQANGVVLLALKNRAVAQESNLMVVDVFTLLGGWQTIKLGSTFSLTALFPWTAKPCVCKLRYSSPGLLCNCGDIIVFHRINYTTPTYMYDLRPTGYYVYFVCLR